MDTREISNVIGDVLNQLKASDKLPVPMLAVKAEKYSQNNPNDTAVVAAAGVLRKLASRETFISRAEFNKIANNFHNTQTKLFDLFKEELGRTEFSGPTIWQRDPNEGSDLNRDYEKVANPLLANALDAAFNPDSPAKMYAKADAKRACRSAQAGLLAVGMEPKRVEVFAGQEDIILCQAEYETPKGSSYVLVPIEIKAGNALLPSMFISEAGFTNVTKAALNTHIRGTAGKALRVNGDKLLEVLSISKNGVKKIASDVELAAIRIQAERGTAASDTNGIVGLHVDQENNNVEPDVPMTMEEITFSESMVRPESLASFVYDNRIVEAGRNMLVRKMSEFGYQGAQVKVADVDEDHIVYAIGVSNQCGFKVPVKVKSGLIMPAKVLISEGTLKAFDNSEVNKLVKSGASDIRALAASSTNSHKKPSELLEIVKEACDEENFTKAEDALNVLADINPEGHSVGIAIMTNSLNRNFNSEKLKKAAEQPVQDVPCMISYQAFYPTGA